MGQSAELVAYLGTLEAGSVRGVKLAIQLIDWPIETSEAQLAEADLVNFRSEHLR
jgi:hypothetical protein